MAMKRFIKVVSKLFLIGLVSLFISGAGLFSSKSEELATDQNVKNIKPFARIEGFRSAKFNMSMDQVKKAIYKDFKLSDDKFSSINNSLLAKSYDIKTRLESYS